MIDKRIFYCWFGKGEMTQLNKKCIESWKRFCPDYEIVEINESNFDYSISNYAVEGYEKGNWSAVSNTARLIFLQKESGIYLDTDILLLKPLDELLEYDGGFITEFDSGQPDSGILGRGSKFPKLYEVALKELTQGSVLHKNFIRNMYQMYDIHGEPKVTYDDGFTVLGEEYIPSVRTGLCTKNTIAIHYFENTWVRNPIVIRDDFYPYQRVRVFVAGKQIHEDKNAKINLEVINVQKKWRGPEILGRMNYFFNPKVVRLQTRDFIAERASFYWDRPTHMYINASGMIITYTED